MNRETMQATVQAQASSRKQFNNRDAHDKNILRLKQETQVLELIAYSLLSVVGVFSLFAALGVDFGTSFDKAPLLLLLTCCSALTYMTRKNKLARLEAEVSTSQMGADE